MEGYLLVLKRSKLSSNISSNFRVESADLEYVWLILDHQVLQFYESLILDKKVAVNKYLSVSLKDFIIEKLKSGSHGVQEGLLLKDSSGKNICLFECGNSSICYSWLTQLNKASKLHLSQTARAGIITRHCYELNIEPSTILSEALLSRSFKRRARDTHPDKGGSSEAFDRAKKVWIDRIYFKIYPHVMWMVSLAEGI